MLLMGNSFIDFYFQVSFSNVILFEVIILIQLFGHLSLQFDFEWNPSGRPPRNLPV